jgi:leucyl-tRNA synthetase
VAEPDLASDDQREYVVQLNGRLRHKIVADADMSADALMALVKSDRQVNALLADGREGNRRSRAVGKLPRP